MLRIDVERLEYGVIDLAFRYGETSYTVPHSYLGDTDALKTFVLMAIDALEPKEYEASCIDNIDVKETPFEGETFHHQLRLQFTDTVFERWEDVFDEYEFVLYYYPWGRFLEVERARTPEGEIVFRGTVTTREFAQAIHDLYDHLIDTYGLREWDEAWLGLPLPLGDFARLRRCLGLPPKTIVLD